MPKNPNKSVQVASAAGVILPRAPEIAARKVTIHEAPSWFNNLPSHSELKSKHQPGIIDVDTAKGSRRMLFMGFNVKSKWEQVTGQEKAAYACIDQFGKLVQVGPKNKSKHDSWDPIQDDPTFHYNIGTILAEPDEVYVDQSKNPQAMNHWKDGVVLNYVKRNYAQSLDTPLTRRAAREYQFEETIVSVKYCNSGENFTLTSVVHRIPTTKKMRMGIE